MEEIKQHQTLAELYRQQNGGQVDQPVQVQTQEPSSVDEAVIRESLARQTYQNSNNVEVIRDEETTGIIIENPKNTNSQGIHLSPGMSEETMNNIDAALKGMDEEIQQAQQAAEEAKARAEQEAAEKAQQEEQEAAARLSEEEYNKAVVIIDKLGMGLANFTPEERAKMERVSKIEVHEIETLKLETLKIKKDPKASIDKVLQAKKNVGGTSNIVAIASGYTAVMGKCSLFELANLFIDKENIVETQLSKWNFIYSKLVSSSVQFKSFDDFIKRTAVVDYNNFIYGILAASYPDSDEIGLNCIDEKCPGKITKAANGEQIKSREYEFSYDVRSLIRIERMNSAVLEKFTKIIDDSYVEDTAMNTHRTSAVNTIKRYRLPESGYIIDASIESVHDFIYNAARVADTLEDEKYRQSLTTAPI